MATLPSDILQDENDTRSVNMAAHIVGHAQPPPVRVNITLPSSKARLGHPVVNDGRSSEKKRYMEVISFHAIIRLPYNGATSCYIRLL